MKQIIKHKLILIALIATLSGCTGKPPADVAANGKRAPIDPDYSGITIPYNIAPLNFKIEDKAGAFYVKISAGTNDRIIIKSRDGIIRIPEAGWKKMLTGNKGGEFTIDIYKKDRKTGWTRFGIIKNRISEEPVDQFVTYRLLYPGYESWKEIFIKQRDLESFKERSVIENSLVEENCLNCHSYNNIADPGNFLVHMRGSLGGTYFLDNNIFRKVNLKTPEMKNGAVYPRWHPSGRFVAFSSNRIVQQFHSSLNKKVEVSDLESSLVLYDIEKNEMMDIEVPERGKYMDTYPEWSPDGRYLYFCRALQVGEIFSYDTIFYDLYRVPFDPSTRKTGEAELIFNASSQKKSISFPRSSPDGNYIVITLHNYGCFPIWHKEADLWLIDLRTKKASEMELNSDFADSYHSWSSNGRWIIFSSKRIDGLTARFFISFIDKNGNAAKPFIMPQKDPEFYGRFIKSFNLPEFSTFAVDISPGKIRRAARGQVLQAKWTTNQP